MIPCSVQGILWFEGHVKVTAIRFSPAPRGAGSDRCEFEQRLRDYIHQIQVDLEALSPLGRGMGGGVQDSVFKRVLICILSPSVIIVMAPCLSVLKTLEPNCLYLLNTSG
jgi:hypothetical protein